MAENKHENMVYETIHTQKVRLSSTNSPHIRETRGVGASSK
jgi:hypothetical protein